MGRATVQGVVLRTPFKISAEAEDEEEDEYRGDDEAEDDEKVICKV
eukprot:CAMPEP_0170454496 /NCGR_PEP_ID=MMETSP0123-20130129/2732_1 /TAXON_ID=182087 /ORGANISM="Favella ehrenbergii, Strain Fehren 1" /LENGTH=45 /DNA_ID= /DNA_START= /DNA_END= /DNA_ORIENTATION=